MLLKNGNLIVGDGSYLERTDLRICGEKIAERGVNLTPHEKEAVVDLTDRWVLPGLIDAHVHVVLSAGADPYAILSRSDPDLTIDAVNNVRRLLYAGFTTVRDVGARNYIDVAVKKAIEEGTIEGPRMMVAGYCIVMTGGHCWNLGGRQADGPDECRKAAREQLFHGVDLLKMVATGGVVTREGEPGLPELIQEEMTAIVEEAHKAGKKATAHCHALEGIRNAVNAGVDSVEQGSFADRAMLEMMAKRGTYLCMCKHATYQCANTAGLPAYLNERGKRVLEAQLATYRLAHELGVKLAFGTDAGTPFNPHGANGKEFAFQVQCGLSEMEAIETATKNAAELLGMLDRVGTLEVGKFADVLVLKDNPLEDIRVLERPDEEIALILKGGQVIKQSPINQ